MRSFWGFLLSFFLVLSCSNSAFVETSAGVETLSRMNKLQRGMKEVQVQNLLGCPEKIEKKYVYKQGYIVWYYVTQGVTFKQTGFYKVNYTPIIFLNGQLYGWGKAFYYNLFKNQRTEGKRGGGLIYTFQSKETGSQEGEKAPTTEKSLDDILEELREEKSFQPLDFDKGKKKQEEPANEKQKEEMKEEDYGATPEEGSEKSTSGEKSKSQDSDKEDSIFWE